MGTLQGQGDLRSPPPTAPSIEAAEALERTVSKPLAAWDMAGAEVPRWSARPASAGCYPSLHSDHCQQHREPPQEVWDRQWSPDLDFQGEVSFAK